MACVARGEKQRTIVNRNLTSSSRTETTYLVDQLVVEVRHLQLLDRALGLLEITRQQVLLQQDRHLAGKRLHGSERPSDAPHVVQVAPALVQREQTASARQRFPGRRAQRGRVRAGFHVERELGRDAVVGDGPGDKVAQDVGRLGRVQDQVRHVFQQRVETWTGGEVCYGISRTEQSKNKKNKAF